MSWMPTSKPAARTLDETGQPKVKDPRVLNLIRPFLTNSIMEGGEYWTPEEGTPQGAVINPLLANICLNPLAHLVAGAGVEMIRYADDFVILCRSRTESNLVLDLVKEWMSEAGLSINWCHWGQTGGETGPHGQTKGVIAVITPSYR